MKRDIDAILESEVLELTIGGKTYTVKDINMDVFLRFIQQRDKSPEERDDVRRQLESALGLKKNELDNVGLRAATLAFDTINEWLRGGGKESEEEEKSESPPLK